MPDARMYHFQMTNIANSYFNYSVPVLKMHSLGVMSYSYIGSIFYFIFGSSMLVMKLFNSFIGTLLVLNVYRISSLISGKKAALISSILIAFWPSVAFWASQNLRDSLVVLSISQVVFLFVMGKYSKDNKFFYFMIFPLIACLLLRYYIGIIISIALIIILLLQLAKINNYLRIFSYLVLLTIFGFILKFLIEYIPAIITLFNYRRNYLAEGGSAFLINVQYSNFGQMLLFIPLGLVYFLFSPFPGSATNIMQLLSSLENIIFYIIFLLAIGGMYRLVKDKKLKLTYFLSIIILSISLFYSVIEANIGTAYRHKMQILPFIIIIASYYFSKMRIFQSNYNVK
jgi:4-amino-4-deoxy-L-arabinose transferase-like glycosyltransferase